MDSLSFFALIKLENAEKLGWWTIFKPLMRDGGEEGENKWVGVVEGYIFLIVIK